MQNLKDFCCDTHKFSLIAYVVEICILCGFRADMQIVGGVMEIPFCRQILFTAFGQIRLRKNRADPQTLFA